MKEAHSSLLSNLVQALNDPATGALLFMVLALLLLAPMILSLLQRTGRIERNHFESMWTRWKSWLWLSAAIILPIMLGGTVLVIAVAVLSFLCFSEFARATGLFREKAISLMVILGICLLALSNCARDHRLFFTVGIVVVLGIAISTIPSDKPSG